MCLSPATLLRVGCGNTSLRNTWPRQTNNGRCLLASPPTKDNTGLTYAKSESHSDPQSRTKVPNTISLTWLTTTQKSSPESPEPSLGMHPLVNTTPTDRSASLTLRCYAQTALKAWCKHVRTYSPPAPTTPPTSQRFRLGLANETMTPSSVPSWRKMAWHSLCRPTVRRALNYPDCLWHPVSVPFLCYLYLLVLHLCRHFLTFPLYVLLLCG